MPVTDLGEHEAAAVEQDQVDLPESATKVALDRSQTLVDEIAAGQLFGGGA